MRELSKRRILIIICLVKLYENKTIYKGEIIMSEYIDKLRLYLDANPIQYADGDSLLEQLYWCYIESNSLDDPELRNQFRKIYSSMPELSEDRFDEIFDGISALTVRQEKLAFQVGAKIGLRLAAELLG